MKPFVNIIPVCDKDKREEAFLERLYSDPLQMDSIIEAAVSPFLKEEQIKGKRLLLKPNWVRHSRKPTDVHCLCTDESVILAFLKYLLPLGPASIIVGDAPVQGCDWSKLLSDNFYNTVSNLSKNSGVAITIKDFRRTYFDPSKNTLLENQKPIDDYVIFDVGRDSYLEDVTSPRNTFRVTCYDPDKLAQTHHKGMHKYCIIKDLFESDVVITIPKIKTHQKAGLTNSLKILVGLNGDKDFLPHHRIGAEGHGGDCYKGWHPFRRASELLLDAANRRRGKRIYPLLSKGSAALWRLSFPKPEQNLAAGWYGNDTVWRMVMDLNLISLFGTKDGTISKEPQRTLYSLCDGIIGGQGNGPLDPDPLALGIVSFTNDAYLMDEIAGRLFKLNIDNVPLLKEARRQNAEKEFDLFINGEAATFDSIDDMAVDVILPPGWINYNR